MRALLGLLLLLASGLSAQLTVFPLATGYPHARAALRLPVHVQSSQSWVGAQSYLVLSTTRTATPPELDLGRAILLAADPGFCTAPVPGGHFGVTAFPTPPVPSSWIGVRLWGKVLLVQGTSAGGVGRHVAALASGLVARGHEVVVGAPAAARTWPAFAAR